MKTTTIQFSQVADGSCILPERFLTMCYRCNIVERCKLEEAKQGRATLYANKQDKLVAELAIVHNKLEKAKEELK